MQLFLNSKVKLTKFHDTAKRWRNDPSQVYGQLDIDYRIHHQLQPDDSHRDSIVCHPLALRPNRISYSSLILAQFR